jgi:hypothetical protein
MTLQQTVKVPANRRVYFDLPKTWTSESVRFEIFPVGEEREIDPMDVPAPGCRLTPRQLAAIEKCRGIAKGIASSNDILENRRKDKELEDAQLRRMLHLDEAVD